MTTYSRLPSGAITPLFALCLYWHLNPKTRFRFNRQSVQANKDLARRTRWGALYFGGLLGTGVMTEMSTPLVWAGILLGATSGIVLAIAYAAGFALGRTSPALAATAGIGRRVGPSMIANFVIIDLRAYTRWLGVAASALGLYITSGR